MHGVEKREPFNDLIAVKITTVAATWEIIVGVMTNNIFYSYEMPSSLVCCVSQMDKCA